MLAKNILKAMTFCKDEVLYTSSIFRRTVKDAFTADNIQ